MPALRTVGIPAHQEVAMVIFVVSSAQTVTYGFALLPSILRASLPSIPRALHPEHFAAQ
jgi:hypothetical protein